MKVRAKTWMKYNGVWRKGGEEFEVSTIEADALKNMVEIAETPVSVSEPKESVTETPKRRGRPRNTVE